MSSSVAPLAMTYSFVLNARQATDKVDLSQLQLVLNAIDDKINEVIASLNVTTGPNDRLQDATVDAATLSPDAWAQIVAATRGTYTPPALPSYPPPSPPPPLA